jgi:hypothetical protein
VPLVEMGSDAMMTGGISWMIGWGGACGGDLATTCEPCGAEVIAHVGI